MNDNWVFDAQESQYINKCRIEFLGRLLGDPTIGFGLKNAVDVGCGIGYFSEFLANRSLKVTAFDVRKENIEEAKTRFQGINFVIGNIEENTIKKLGPFDLVCCFGLLYHLENPFRAIRNLFTLTKHILIIESIVSPSQSPIAALVRECHGKDQGQNYIAFIPSRSCLVTMLYQSGFSEVYATVELPDHKEFRKTLFRHRRRTILVASKVPLQSRSLKRIPEPNQQNVDIWRNKITLLFPQLFRILRKVHARMRTLPAKIFSIFPLPIRLDSGIWFLTWNDVMGNHIRHHVKFEHGEQRFLMQFLESGMTVLDIGAHHGFYSLLASRKVGSHGLVLSFEPSPRELRRLRFNLFLNRSHNVRVVSSALGDKEGATKLYVCLGSETGCNSLRPPAVAEPVKKQQVHITTIDQYIKKTGIGKVDFIKLDVEGAELEVLQGAGALLTGNRPLILCELADVRTLPWGYRSIEIYEFLKKRGFQWFSISPEGRLRHCPKKERFHENLLAVPKEKRRHITRYMIGE